MKLISDAHIQKLEEQQHEKFHNMLDAHASAKEKSWEQKEQWIAVFLRCLSPSIACKQVGVSLSTYRRWRNTDPKFCKAINRAMELSHEELQTSAYARATGYFKPDPDSGSGYEEDAAGRPIRYGQSDRLAIALIQPPRHHSEQAIGGVTVNLNFGALGIDKPSAIEGETVQADEKTIPTLGYDKESGNDI